MIQMRVQYIWGVAILLTKKVLATKRKTGPYSLLGTVSGTVLMSSPYFDTHL
jgi:hypothetical protein